MEVYEIGLIILGCILAIHNIYYIFKIVKSIKLLNKEYQKTMKEIEKLKEND